MKANELTAKYSMKLSDAWWDRVARKALLAVLSKIERGRLTVHEPHAVHHFGKLTRDCKLDAHIYVKHISAYRQVLLGGTVGSGEAYMANAWWSPDLVQVIRIFVANMAVMQTMDSKWSQVQQWSYRLRHSFKRNSKRNSKRNIAAHYDLGNAFYALFLDETMMYSSAEFPQADTPLLAASTYKLHSVCEQLQLTEDDHLLEIGCGWGGLAIYAAKHFGCRVTSITLSSEQYEYATQWVAREGLAHKIEIRLQDYREVQGQFDKLVSIEMIEAVGHQYYSTFFAKCASLLKDSGLMLIQAITIADQRYEQEKHNADFIQTYIFPGGSLPSITALCQNMTRHSDLLLVGQKEIGLHYAQTLAHWRERFNAKLEEVKALGFDEVFIRMWEFYLCYCEGGFRERAIGTSQLLFAKPRWQCAV